MAPEPRQRPGGPNCGAGRVAAARTTLWCRAPGPPSLAGTLGLAQCRDLTAAGRTECVLGCLRWPLGESPETLPFMG